MTVLADLFEKELLKYEVTEESAQKHKGLLFLGKELAKKYREQQETLASVATLYVKEVYSRPDARS